MGLDRGVESIRLAGRAIVPTMSDEFDIGQAERLVVARADMVRVPRRKAITQPVRQFFGPFGSSSCIK
jgi:hypothetical protein